MATALAQAPTNYITGTVIEKESGAGIPNLLVVLFDLDNWKDPESRNPDDSAARSASSVGAPDENIDFLKNVERTGSQVTDGSGRFRFELIQKDYNLPGKSEQKPDLLLVVLAPDEPGLTFRDRLLHFTRDLYFNAGQNEAYIIRLSSALLAEREISLASEPLSDTNHESRAKSFLAAEQSARRFDSQVAAERTSQFAERKAERDDFKVEIKSMLASDPAKAPLPGPVVKAPADIPKSVQTIARDGVARANEVIEDSGDGVPIALFLTEDDRTHLQSQFDAATDGFASIDASLIDPIRLRANSAQSFGTLLVSSNPIAAHCAGESFDEQCAHDHLAPPGEELEPSSGTDTDHAHADGGQPEDPAPPRDVLETLADNDIGAFLARLVQDMPSPDQVLNPELLRKRATPEQLKAKLEDFALPKGPAEAPAKYYSSTLEIAFDHVWRQLFDETIPNLAYTADTLAETKLGAKGFILPNLLNGGLLANLLQLTATEVPSNVAKHFDITLEEYNELTASHRDELRRLAGEISARLSGPDASHANGGVIVTTSAPLERPSIRDMRAIQRFTEQGDRLIEMVRGDNLRSLHKTLRELEQRLAAAYEFTVFAADKDHHAVNFGIIKTLEQEWTPLAVQPGRVVKTIPLAPKEERRYSIKTKRTEKRSTKEAKKHNQALTNEQSATSRVEAAIVAKANSKTNFSTVAEGDYDILISSGKATTTFGVEAGSETSQDRKDFRESVLKAVQEFKDELSIEVTTDSEYSLDSDESGLVANPNDELALTFIFYELQKRYRLFERLYRITPVVLVAQEVPSPDQITPAWVLANDWIIRRVLLDDSFLPALDYIANRSVGDDFGLREMRRNLRQQRNLVETLRIEFSAASMEANNRYRALAQAIDARIDEEHDERTDGFFSDVSDWFTGDGQDPEAARARELAAKDAHQYALEKAEKAASALRQETVALSQLTDAYNKTAQARLDNETKLKRLLVHLKNNILYYMQAIWSLEPRDQQALRLYKVQVPVLEMESRTYKVAVAAEPDIFKRFREPGTERHRAYLKGKLKTIADPEQPPPTDPAKRFRMAPLVEVADMTPVACFGNYLAFRLKAHNALTELMAAPYVDEAFGAMDPDSISNVSLDQFSKFVCCLHDEMEPDKFEDIREGLKDWFEQLLSSPLRNGDEIVVPTGSLFIETLVDPNPCIEDFKLMHRELDVFKVQEEVRRAGLENLRLAARLVNKERSDPDIDKKIVVAGSGVGPVIDVDNT